MTLSILLLNYSWLILYFWLISLIFIKEYLQSMSALAQYTALSKLRWIWYLKVGLSLFFVWWREKYLKKRDLWCDIFWQRRPTLSVLYLGGLLGKLCRQSSGGFWRWRLIQEELWVCVPRLEWWRFSLLFHFSIGQTAQFYFLFLEDSSW